jgi:hypothetical protein
LQKILVLALAGNLPLRERLGLLLKALLVLELAL